MSLDQISSMALKLSGATDDECERQLDLLKALVTWALSSSDAVQAFLKESYKQVRREDDINQPLSIQPWGQDGQKRKYWLIEGQDDTEFRLYRESSTKRKPVTWWSVAGDVDELKTVAAHLADEGSQAARRLSERIGFAFSRLEASLEVSVAAWGTLPSAADPRRNAGNATIGRHARPSSSAETLASLSTRAAPGGRR